MPNLPGGNARNAEGAQGMTASGPGNVFEFQGDPGSPLATDGRYDVPGAQEFGEGVLGVRPEHGKTTLQMHALPHPLA